eukprot:SM000223S07316  [mRNA]  locus=s223:134272:137477:+ [translate_table: standard]
MAAMAAAAAAVLLTLSAALADGAREAASPEGGACLPGFALGPRSGACLLAAPGPATFGQAEADSRLAVVATVGATIDALPRLQAQRRGGRLATLLGRLALEDAAELCRALPGGTGDGGSSGCLVGATRGLQPGPPWRWTEPCASFSTDLWLATTTPSAASPLMTGELHCTQLGAHSLPRCGLRRRGTIPLLKTVVGGMQCGHCDGGGKTSCSRQPQQQQRQWAAVLMWCQRPGPRRPGPSGVRLDSAIHLLAVGLQRHAVIGLLLGVGHAHGAGSDGERRHLRVESKTSKTKKKTKKTKKSKEKPSGTKHDGRPRHSCNHHPGHHHVRCLPPQMPPPTGRAPAKMPQSPPTSSRPLSPKRLSMPPPPRRSPPPKLQLPPLLKLQPPPPKTHRSPPSAAAAPPSSKKPSRFRPVRASTPPPTKAIPPPPSVSKQAQAGVSLLAFKAAVRDPHGYLTNWIGTTPCASHWNGVFCEDQAVAAASLPPAEASAFGARLAVRAVAAQTQVVVAGLDLNGFGLHGYVLQFLRNLPPELLRRRTARSKRTDTRLDVLAVNNNALKEPIPTNLGSLPVSFAVLAHNALRGLIPASIGQLAPTLSELVLLDNGLIGGLPVTITQLRSTLVLNFADNRLNGGLPLNIGNLTSLVQHGLQLDIAGNRFAGNITTSGVFFLPNLQLFNYKDNSFVGKPPPNTTIDVVIGEDCSSGHCQAFGPPPPGNWYLV